MDNENEAVPLGAVWASCCPQCGVLKTPETTGTRIVGGRQLFVGTCRECSRLSTRRWRFRDIKGSLLSGAKSRAKKNGFPFNLEIEDIVIPDYCPALGIPLEIVPGMRTDASPTLDKVHNDMGYVKGNVVVVSWKANRLKNNATIHELQSLAEFYSKFIGSQWMKPHERK